MIPTRRTQPYRRKIAPPGPIRNAMRKGSPTYLPNPQDTVRATQRRARRKSRLAR